MGNRMWGKETRGFTLVNVLVVAGILVILAGLLCLGFSLARCAAEETKVVHRAAHIGYALKLYYIDHRKYPDSYPAQLDSRLAPYLEDDLRAYFQDPAGFEAPAHPGKGAEPLNESYVAPPVRSDPNRYVLTIDPLRRTARSAVLFANDTVELVDRLPVHYGNMVLKPGDVVSGGTLTFATRTTVELSGDTMARAVHSFTVDDSAAFHIVKLPRYRHGYLRADAVKGDTVHIVTGPGVVCVRNGVADVDVVPVPAVTEVADADPGDDPTSGDYTPTEVVTPPGGRLGDYAIFSGQRIAFGGNPTVDHLIGSNGDVSVGQARANSADNSKDILGGGALVLDGNFSAAGDVIQQGSVTVSKNAEVKGNIDSGSDVIVRGTVWGDVTARGSVNIDGGTVKGAVTSGVNLTLDKKAIVYRDAACGGEVNNQGTLEQGVSQIDAGAVTPESPPLPLALPPQTEFSPGTQNVTLHGDETLSPGQYGNLTLLGGTQLSLEPGRYYFRSVTTGGDTQIRYKIDRDEGVEIFILDDANFGGNIQTAVDGSGSAAGVYIETHGNWTVQGTAELDGTLYAPAGGIRMAGGATLRGACYARDDVELSGTCDVRFVPCGRGIGDSTSDGDDEDDGGTGDDEEEDSGGGSGSGGPMNTLVRVLNHSAEVTVDAKILRRGHDVPYIAPREGPYAGCTQPRVLGAGSSVRIGDWATVERFLGQ